MRTMGVAVYPTTTNAVSFEHRAGYRQMKSVGDVCNCVSGKLVRPQKNNPSNFNKRGWLVTQLRGFRNRGDI